MDSKVDVLKACPFCGGAAEPVEMTDEHGRFVAVACPACGAGSCQHYFCGEDAHDHARAAWNQRANSEAIAELIAADREYDAAFDAWSAEEIDPEPVYAQFLKAKRRRAAILARIKD